jgi:hypothetical protein
MVLAIAPPAVFDPATFDPIARFRRAVAGGPAFAATFKALLEPPSEDLEVGATAMPPAVTGERQDDRRDRSARRNAMALLDELQSLQRDLLRAGVAPASLGRIAALAGDLAPLDPALGEICAAIALRARVETAKLQRGAAPVRHHP